MIEGFYLSNWPMGWLVAYRVGVQIGPMRQCVNHQEILKDLEPMIGERPEELDGFTLFYHPGKGWQLSTRKKGLPGWSVRHIPDDEGLAILARLEKQGHPIMLDREESIRQYGRVEDPIKSLKGRSYEELKADLAAHAEAPAVLEPGVPIRDALAAAERARDGLTGLIAGDRT